MESSSLPASITQADLERYRQRLLAAQDDLVRKLERKVEEARTTSDDQADPVDQGRIDELRDQFLELAETDAATLAQIRDALRRLDEGTFGRCIVDGKPIERKRLDAVPWTPYCARHQEEAEARARVRTPRV